LTQQCSSLCPLGHKSPARAGGRLRQHRQNGRGTDVRRVRPWAWASRFAHPYPVSVLASAVLAIVSQEPIARPPSRVGQSYDGSISLRRLNLTMNRDSDHLSLLAVHVSTPAIRLTPRRCRQVRTAQLNTIGINYLTGSPLRRTSVDSGNRGMRNFCSPGWRLLAGSPPPSRMKTIDFFP
jgi:hypothetical protein